MNNRPNIRHEKRIFGIIGRIFLWVRIFGIIGRIFVLFRIFGMIGRIFVWNRIFGIIGRIFNNRFFEFAVHECLNVCLKLTRNCKLLLKFNCYLNLMSLAWGQYKKNHCLRTIGPKLVYLNYCSLDRVSHKQFLIVNLCRCYFFCS